MNPSFKSKYDQMREGKPTETEGKVATSSGGDNNYSEPGHIRNLCFVWPDGKRQFLNYNYLVSGEYLPENSTIFLEFTTHTVKLVGQNLQKLYDQIMMQIALRITCIDDRYNKLEASNQLLVNKIELSKSE